jgi:hypothetical protein
MRYPPVSPLSNHFSNQTNCQGIAVRVFIILIFLINGSEAQDSSDAKEVPGHKTWKDRLTLELGGNIHAYREKNQYL